MTRATGVEPMARKAAYHQISRTYLNERGIPAMARPAKVRISPKASTGPSTRLRPRHAFSVAGASVERFSVAIVSPQRQLGVEEGQHGRREDVLEDRDAHEAPHDGRVHRLCHPFGAAAGGDSLEDAYGGHDGA